MKTKSEGKAVDYSKLDSSGTTSTMSSAMQALMDFYKDVPSKVSNYSSSKNTSLLSKAANIFTDPDNWKKGTGFTEDEAKDAFEKFFNTFSKPATDTSKVGGEYGKVEYIKMYREVKKKNPSSKMLNGLKVADASVVKNSLEELAKESLGAFS